MICFFGYEYDVGFCYEFCKEGFVGVVFVCWGEFFIVNVN